MQAFLDVKPDVVFIDIGLPGIDGYEVVRQVRASANAAPPTLIALTGYGRAEDRERMERAGFDTCLIKPVEPASITEAMAHTGRSRMERNRS